MQDGKKYFLKKRIANIPELSSFFFPSKQQPRTFSFPLYSTISTSPLVYAMPWRGTSLFRLARA